MRRALPMLVLMLCGCPPPGPVQPDEPPAPPGFDAADVCDAAAQNMKRLRCPGWQGSPGRDEQHGTGDEGEVGFAEVCRDNEEAAGGIAALSLHPDCVAAARDCAEVDRCREE